MDRRLLVLFLLVPLVGGCATKRDLRNLQTEVEELRTAQATAMREIQRQNAMILDSLATQSLRMRGDIANQLVQMERQLVQIQELTGQGQQGLRELRDQIRTREETLAAGSGSAAANAAAGNPDEIFNTALASLRRGSVSTARAGFEEFLRAYPQHPLASEAQFHVGEAFAEANDHARALEAYRRVLELYPTAAKAPTALYRSGMIEAERGNRDAARTHFNQVVTAYPRSVEAPLAREQIQRLGRR